MDGNMTKKKKSTDVNVTVFQILEAITGELPCHASPNPTGKEPAKKKDPPEKNPAAVALGGTGGLKGGTARAAKLSSKNRKEIAKEAAATRWKNGR
jgi:hypothetical protein